MIQISQIQPKRLLGAKMLGARNKYMSPVFFVVVALLSMTLSPAPAFAGLAEAKAAYDAKDYKTAFKEYLPLAEAGNAEAQYRIGRMYRDGKGITSNYRQSIKWFISSANNKNIPVLVSLGYMAGKGMGLPASISKENCFYKLAADQGNKAGQWNLYMNLSDSFFSMDEAIKWLNRAVKQGQDNALARKGALLIVDPLNFDKTEGLMYLVLAQKYGDDPEVDEYIEEIVGDNPTRQKQLEKAKVMAAKWKPVKEIPPTDLPPINIEGCLKF